MKIENCKLKIPAKRAGFTLLELIVVIAIAMAITTALVVQQNSWNDQLTVNTQAYELALMIRQAQIYSLGVRENVGSTASDKFKVGYGIFFGQLSTDSSDPQAYEKRYIFFADVNNNGIYNEGVDNKIETKTLTRGVTIDKFCGIKGSGQFDEKCYPGAPGTGNVSYEYISFLRPDPKANIVFLNNGGNTSSNVIPPASVYLKSPKGKYFRVRVESNGQVSISQSAPE